MFNLDVSKTYWWPVAFSVPAAEGSQLEAMDFEVEFRRFEQKQIDDMMRRANEKRMADSELAPELVVNWRQVVGAGGVVPFTAPNFTRLLAIPGAGSAIMKAYLESISKGAEKN